TLAQARARLGVSWYALYVFPCHLAAEPFRSSPSMAGLLCLAFLFTASGLEFSINAGGKVANVDGEVSLLQRDVDMSRTSLHPQPIVAYFINMDTEDRRRAHMEQQARAAKLPLRRYQAINRERISRGEFDEKYVKRQNLSAELLDTKRQKDHVANATVACYVSHSELLEMLHRQLQPHQIGVVLEDDVEIPHNWAELIEQTVACAPSDWSLLKVSGWGYNRATDLQKPGEPDASNSSGMGLMSWLQSQGGWMSRILYGAPARKGTTRRNNMTRSQLIQLTAKALADGNDPSNDLVDQLEESLGAAHEPEPQAEEGCPDAYLMRRPFKETFWWHFWGPAYHYAGTGAYLVKASSIPSILQHLRSQPINDIDGMLLSKGDLRAYELWPHIFPLTGDHMRSTMLESRKTSTAGLLDSLSSLVPEPEGTAPKALNTSESKLMMRAASATKSSRIK
ncbi:unnamed protein product, partial [Effrenium voratum]